MTAALVAPRPARDPVTAGIAWAETRRRNEARGLAREILEGVSKGFTELRLLALIKRYPRDLDETETGFALSLYGTTTPPQGTITAALICWATLTLEGVE